MRPIDADVSIEKIKSLPIELDAKTIQRCIEVLSNMPSADWDLPSTQAERYAQGFADRYKVGMKDTERKGHWVLVNRGLDIYMCDQCGEILQIDRLPIWDYCPLCGARMGGETDGRPNQQTGGDSMGKN